MVLTYVRSVSSVYHPKKPDYTRMIFYAFAKLQGIHVSLNNVLPQGPDLYNRLLVILLRFFRENIHLAGTLDDKQLLHKVLEDQWCYLRIPLHLKTGAQV